MTDPVRHDHIDRFNAAVLSGDWSALIATLHPDAVMTFAGVPVGPFHGRQAIADAYATNPPGDTMRVVEVRPGTDGETVAFAWSRGGTGTLDIRRRAGQIIGLHIRFD
ncbi:nuclear transport factor 2 family protein [Paractinoplanes toevensis]|nr:nuclear transport factor 2 family protein [Actinoplanes toevensis]